MLALTIDSYPPIAYNVCKCITGGHMLKAASVTVRVKPSTKTRLEALADATKRSKSYVIEEALEQYLDVNEWQIEGIARALTEADKPEAVFVDHDEVLAKWEKKLAG
jgi:predicted transcriptional regulator